MVTTRQIIASCREDEANPVIKEFKKIPIPTNAFSYYAYRENGMKVQISLSMLEHPYTWVAFVMNDYTRPIVLGSMRLNHAMVAAWDLIDTTNQVTITRWEKEDPASFGVEVKINGKVIFTNALTIESAVTEVVKALGPQYTIVVNEGIESR